MQAPTRRSEMPAGEVRRAARAQGATPGEISVGGTRHKTVLMPPTRSLPEHSASGVWEAVLHGSLLPTPQTLPPALLSPTLVSPHALLGLGRAPISTLLPACGWGMVWAIGGAPTYVLGGQRTFSCPQAPGSGVQL